MPFSFTRKSVAISPRTYPGQRDRTAASRSTSPTAQLRGLPPISSTSLTAPHSATTQRLPTLHADVPDTHKTALHMAPLRNLPTVGRLTTRLNGGRVGRPGVPTRSLCWNRGRCAVRKSRALTLTRRRRAPVAAAVAGVAARDRSAGLEPRPSDRAAADVDRGPNRRARGAGGG
jgi:hypothetical protein